MLDLEICDMDGGILVKRTLLSWSFVDIFQFPEDKLEKRPKPEGPNDSFCSK